MISRSGPAQNPSLPGPPDRDRGEGEEEKEEEQEQKGQRQQQQQQGEELNAWSVEHVAFGTHRRPVPETSFDMP